MIPAICAAAFLFIYIGTNLVGLAICEVRRDGWQGWRHLLIDGPDRTTEGGR